MADASTRAVARRLQTACNAIEKLYFNEWTDATAEGKQSLLLLRHFAKRLKSSSDGYFDGLPVFDTGVESGLEDDRLNDMNDLLNSISNKMRILGEVWKKAQKHLIDCEELYKRLCSPGLSNATSGHKIIDVLFRKFFRIVDLMSQNYENRRVLFHSVSSNDLTSIEQLIDAWECRSESRLISLFIQEATSVTSKILQSKNETDVSHNKSLNETDVSHNEPLNETDASHNKPLNETDASHNKPLNETDGSHSKPMTETGQTNAV